MQPEGEFAKDAKLISLMPGSVAGRLVSVCREKWLPRARAVNVMLRIGSTFDRQRDISLG